MERAAARFWGTLTRGAHANGYVAGADGRPLALWIAQRAFTKATDPGLHDNLVGGGVPAGQSPWETLQREGFEEAGLDAECMAAARPGRVLAIDRAVPEGWQHEHLHVFDLALPADRVPHNQDGEVQGFELLPVTQAIARARGGSMTVDASLATLDFLLRHRLLGPEHGALEAALAPLVQID
jgi:8-oxo-dGTP pyrophosphatase MutT (NUDIX family)